jgi:hypothetical protein
VIARPTLSQIAKYNGIRQLQSTVANGAQEIFVDGPKVPAGSIGIVTMISQGHPTIMAGNLGAFLCDQSMGWNNPPLLQNGALDPGAVGPLIGADGSNGQNIGSMTNFVGMFFLAEQMFIRFSSFLAPGVFPVAGNFATVRMAIAIIPLCECEV